MNDPNPKNAVPELAFELIMLDAESGEEAWLAFAGRTSELREQLTPTAPPLPEGLEAAGRLALFIAEAPPAERRAGIELLNDLLTALQTLAEDDPSSRATIKDRLARVRLFLQDRDTAATPAEAMAPDIEEEFLLEIQARLEGLETLLFNTDLATADAEHIRGIFREFHTLKGESGLVGLTALNAFCHRVESEIEGARHGELRLTEGILECLEECTNLARRLLGTSGDLPNPDSLDASVLALHDAVADSAARPGPGRPPAPPAGQTSPEEEPFFPAPPEPAGAPGNEPAPEATVAEVQAEPVTQEAPPPGVGSEEAAPEPAGPAPKAEEEEVGESSLQSVTMDVRKLDSLMDLVGEVANLGTQVGELEAIQELPETGGLLVDLQRACRSLQEMTAGLRMTPVRPLFHRIQRAAFAAARQEHKRVEIEIEGGETEVDRSVMEHLTAALVHIARNAVGHGIEPPDTRRAAGKPERGRLRLRAYRMGADAVIEVADDGRGLDLDRIRAKAQALGRLPADREPTRDEVLRTIFLSGLSTAESVTGLSGRGVGMDAVQTAMNALRGRVEVETEAGAGTLVRLRFAVALAAIEGLLLEVGESRLVLPVTCVREMFRVGPEAVDTIEGQGRVVRIRGVVVPVLHLGKTLGLPHRADRPEEGVLILLEEEDRLVAVLVDEVRETRQVVVRPLEGNLADIPDVTGAALLPDRRVALVLDSRRLTARASVRARETLEQASQAQVSSERGVETVTIGSNQVGMIDFAVNGQNGHGPVVHRFAINAFKAREFVEASELTPLPNAPRGFAGMLLLRGRTLPVVSLGELLGLFGGHGRDPAAEPIILICEFAGQTVGFLVTTVNRVSYISWGDILPPPESGGLATMEYVVGTILADRLAQVSAGNGETVPAGRRREADIVLVLDFERIVQSVLSLYGEMTPELGGAEGERLGRVLLVEDSPLIRRETRRALEAAGLEVTEAADGQTALDIVTELHEQATAAGTSIFAHLDLVLSDIEMPRCDGYTLTASLKRHPQLRVLPILLHSSITNETMIARAREVEADGFVPKCDPRELAVHLRKFL